MKDYYTSSLKKFGNLNKKITPQCRGFLLYTQNMERSTVDIGNYGT
jgi:hypothetical protein